MSYIGDQIEAGVEAPFRNRPTADDYQREIQRLLDLRTSDAMRIRRAYGVIGCLLANQIDPPERHTWRQRDIDAGLSAYDVGDDGYTVLAHER